METGISERKHHVPVSLGKPSLRRRLEDYYSMVAPDQLQLDWIKRFQQIWEKYGGSHEGEAKLASKLMKKYGSTVRFLSVASVEQAETQTLEAPKAKEEIHLESFFDLTVNQNGSGQLNFLCSTLDPLEALSAPIDQVYKANSWMSTSGAILDRVDQCRFYLPDSDPLYQMKTITRKRERPSEKVKALSAFAMIAGSLECGPFSVLHKCMMERKRVRVIIRYVNCVRGTMTGYVIGFDKHMNLILRDVDEVYTPRFVDSKDDDCQQKSNLEVEKQRRILGASGSKYQGRWTLRQRHLKQVLVRGDNIVAVYRAEQEQSAWPATTRSTHETLYRIRTVRKDMPPAERVGTPGSLLYASQRKQNAGSRNRENYSSQKDIS